jgi:hypothetical protein
MSDGDSIQAGHITTAYSTTDLVAEQERKTFGTKAFVGDVIFRVGPTDNATNGLMPDTTLDGVQGAGNQGGSGLIGTGGFYVSDQFSGVGVLGVGGPPNPFSQVSNSAGVGIKGVAGGAADGIVGTSDAQSKSGVFGFNSLSSTHTDIAGYGVFGLCNTVGGVGVASDRKTELVLEGTAPKTMGSSG